jgi:ubiquinone/menaquinone biosynthesis C-methylase UbiE
MKFYEQKEELYFINPRIDLISLMPRKADNRVLEVGAGGGDTLVEIKKQNLAVEVVGLELMTIPGSHQNDPSIDRFVICDIEKSELDFPDSYFDVILLGDVMEHLLDPWDFLRKASRVLKKGGVILASMPNIRYYTAMIRIFFKGDFRYENHGLFDRTHFRWYCKKNLKELFETPTLSCREVFSRSRLLKLGWTKTRIFNLLTFGLFEEFLTLQYIIIAERK